MRPFALKGYGSKAHEAKAKSCFSIMQLVGEKRQESSQQLQVEETFIWE